MRIYISGPITGVEDYEAKFDEAEKLLREIHPEAQFVNPARLSKVFQGGAYSQYIDICLYMLNKCDAVYMMPGWEKSKGACIEHGYALAQEKMVVVEGEGI